jgi:hypothetical protein
MIPCAPASARGGIVVGAALKQPEKLSEVAEFAGKVTGGARAR